MNNIFSTEDEVAESLTNQYELMRERVRELRDYCDGMLGGGTVEEDAVYAELSVRLERILDGGSLP